MRNCFDDKYLIGTFPDNFTLVDNDDSYKYNFEL